MLAFILWLIIGGIAGWIASKIMGTDAQQGIFLNIVVGVIGALLGGWILSMLGFDGTSNWFFTLLTAIAGACLLLFIVGLVTKKR